MFVFDYRQLRRLCDASPQQPAAVSLDLGLTETEVQVTDVAVTLPDGIMIPRSDIAACAKDDENIYHIVDGVLKKVARFSEETGKFYTMRPTATWPSLEISGITMHRIKNADPASDAKVRIDRIAPLTGHVLDTCGGLGYTAVTAAQFASKVTVLEIDPNVADLCRINPYSRGLFELDHIDYLLTDAAEYVEDVPDATFQAIVHDPPTFAVAGDLYSAAIYEQFLRILQPGGRLFHYTGAPGSRRRGQDLPSRVATRLNGVGFEQVQVSEEVQGVLARKPRMQTYW